MNDLMLLCFLAGSAIWGAIVVAWPTKADS
jgi:hypothetical protein